MMYEFLYILPAQYTDQELAAMQAKVVVLLEGVGAKIAQQDATTKLKMGYPIKQHRYGHYSIIRFEAETAALPKIQNQLRLTTDIARFQITKIEGLPKIATTLLSFEDAKTRPRENREEYGASRAHVSSPTNMPLAESLTVPAATPAISMEDLDKKLDEILNEQVN